MNILLASESFVIRESLEILFKSIVKDATVKLTSNLDILEKFDLFSVDFIFIDIKKDNEHQIDIIKEAKLVLPHLKVMVLDINKSKLVFEKSIRYGIEGYLSNIEDKDDFIYMLKKVLKGKKVYEADLVKQVIDNNQIKYIQELTKREIEVLYELGKGLNNRDIAKNLYISEYTVKKHVSNILDKLNLKNRQEIIIYASNNR